MRLSRRFLIFFLILIVLPITIGVFYIFFQKIVIENELKPEPIPLSANLIGNSDTNIIAKTDIGEESASFPPEIIKAVYITSWSASKEIYIDYVINLARTTEINAVVIDIKDFSGYVGYDIALPEVEKYNAKQIRITDINSLIEKFHKEEIYVIARITVFQDPILARARPDLAIHSKSRTFSLLWFDNMGLAWIDPNAKDAWDYNIAIAKDAVERGFDEINFDYVRFPSDGDLEDMIFSSWDRLTPRHLVIKEFFKYLRQELPDVKLSIDLFGLTTVSFYGDLGVGQIIEDAFEYFDFVCPMIYPSHYADGFLEYQNPAEYPYEVVKYSMENALKRLLIYKQSKPIRQKRDVQIRPWLQDFNLGAIYDAKMVRSEIEAVNDALGDNFKGFMLWSSLNFYTKEALQSND